MKRYEWQQWTEPEAACRRAGGRRRYNAMRQRRAWERRRAIEEWLDDHPLKWLFTRGLPGLLAPAFGVHRTTIWRDLQRILYPPRQYDFLDADGELLFTIYRTCHGGPILNVTDPYGNEIRGNARRSILRRLPRYYGKR